MSSQWLEFWKMNGSGNDFILVDNRAGAVPAAEMPELVRRACRRRTSVGADGLIFIESSPTCDFKWRYFNADGGEVAMCGNGSRCAARYAYLNGISGPRLTFESLAGPIQAEVAGRRVKVAMPNPVDLTLEPGLEPQPGWRHAAFVNTGVPHVVVEVEDLEGHPVIAQGRYIRYHPRFAPAGTNANFVTRTAADAVAIRTYERGVEDETLACGTGAIASALIAARRHGLLSPVRVKTRGGEELLIHFQRQDGSFSHIRLQGLTAIVYRGRLDPEALLD